MVSLQSEVQQPRACPVCLDGTGGHPDCTAVVIVQHPDRERTHALPVLLKRQTETELSGGVATRKCECSRRRGKARLAPQRDDTERRDRIAAKLPLDGP